MGTKPNRDRTLVLSEGERLMLRYMLVDKTPWIRAAKRALSLGEEDAVAALAAVEILEQKLAKIS